jgi:hypothetical protein
MKPFVFVTGVLAAALLAGCNKAEPESEAAKATTGTSSSMSQYSRPAPTGPGGAPNYGAVYGAPGSRPAGAPGGGPNYGSSYGNRGGGPPR